MGDVNLAKLTKPQLIEKIETARTIWKADQTTIEKLKNEIEKLKNEIEKLKNEIENLQGLLNQRDATISKHYQLLSDLLTQASVAARHTADIKMKLKPYAQDE